MEQKVTHKEEEKNSRVVENGNGKSGIDKPQPIYNFKKLAHVWRVFTKLLRGISKAFAPDSPHNMNVIHIYNTLIVRSENLI